MDSNNYYRYRVQESIRLGKRFYDEMDVMSHDEHVRLSFNFILITQYTYLD